MVFESMQQTTLATSYVLDWLNGKLPTSVKASLPPFNLKAKHVNIAHMRTANAVKEFINLPSFGLKIPQVACRSHLTLTQLWTQDPTGSIRHITQTWQS